MGNYSCFFCPRLSFAPAKANDNCINCGRKLAFPILFPPDKVRNFKIIGPAGLGFYSAVFSGYDGENPVCPLILKISPKSSYEFFDKDFYQECDHYQLMMGCSDNSVRLLRFFEEVVKFSSHEILCYIMVQENAGDHSLNDLICSDLPFASRDAVSISIDILTFIQDLHAAKIFHNDLHASNIMLRRLTDHTIRATVIDFGSMSSLSRTGGHHLSDLEWAAKHLQDLASALNRINDTSSKIVPTLNAVAEELKLPSPQPDLAAMIDRIECSFLKERLEQSFRK